MHKHCLRTNVSLQYTHCTLACCTLVVHTVRAFFCTWRGHHFHKVGSSYQICFQVYQIVSNFSGYQILQVNQIVSKSSGVSNCIKFWSGVSNCIKFFCVSNLSGVSNCIKFFRCIKLYRNFQVYQIVSNSSGVSNCIKIFWCIKLYQILIRCIKLYQILLVYQICQVYQIL